MIVTVALNFGIYQVYSLLVSTVKGVEPIYESNESETTEQLDNEAPPDRNEALIVQYGSNVSKKRRTTRYASDAKSQKAVERAFKENKKCQQQYFLAVYITIFFCMFANLSMIVYHQVADNPTDGTLYLVGNYASLIFFFILAAIQLANIISSFVVYCNLSSLFSKPTIQQGSNDNEDDDVFQRVIEERSEIVQQLKPVWDEFSWELKVYLGLLLYRAAIYGTLRF